MNSFFLLIHNISRNKVRWFLNTFALIVAFFLFGFLGSFYSAFESGAELAANDRLIVMNKINFTQPLPYSYINKVNTMDGVKQLTHASWFGAYYLDPTDPLIGYAVDADTYLSVYDNYVLDDEMLINWQQTPVGMLVGRAMAERYGWQVGDKVAVSSNLFSHKSGGQDWEVLISGIYDGKDAQTDTDQLFLHYDYFAQTRTSGGNTIGWMVLTTENAKGNDAIMVGIDDRFENSIAETRTTTERQFNKAFVEQLGSIGLIITAVLSAVFFAILLVVGNSISMTVRERTREIGVLKALGFSRPQIFKLVLSEAMFLTLSSGTIGLTLSYFALDAMGKIPQIQSIVPALLLTPSTVLQAVMYMLLLGGITGALPAYRAMSLNTVDALRRS
ncbi:ABC transporter permease [Shewanella sp. D64]|uniref:ABC transporter permease n=1 Tax=unclassified Shewanella TaxID=196818 RepID=UPI0022BA382C|nr:MULTISPECIES: ABC transporter permease [unclassified Shewanella]MEC4725324.1 ABC transporter permease [Shewanella sp. D64]MEC4735830.1 ABC transporter permease [Shewanella sp. E94]WBJ93199.1 ABC transporter permease [Shewanella sp. MTB7]